MSIFQSKARSTNNRWFGLHFKGNGFLPIFLALATISMIALGGSNTVRASQSSANTFKSTIADFSLRKPSLITKDVLIQKDGYFDSSMAFGGGHDSRGNALNMQDITVVGRVSSDFIGTYFLQYIFVDPYTKERVTKDAKVIVTWLSAGERLENSQSILFSHNMVVKRGSLFEPQDAFVAAFDSYGRQISLKDISVTGKVNTNRVGNYFLQFNFVDPYTLEEIDQIAKIIVSNSLFNIIPVLLTRNIKVMKDGYFDPEDAFIGAFDSHGQSVNVDDIRVIGSVNVGQSGTYFVRFSFVDSYTWAEIDKTVEVTIY